MASNRKPFSMDHPVVVLFVVIAVVASMGLAAEVLKPLSLSVLLAFALTPFARFFERRGLPRVASVVLTVVIAMAGLSGVGYIVAGELDGLATDLTSPAKRDLIEKKLSVFKRAPGSNYSKVEDTLKSVAKSIDPEASRRKDQEGATPESSGTPLAGDKTLTGEKIQQVEVVSAPRFRERLQEAVGPFLEVLTLGSFILILVLFMMVGRDDLGDRIIALFGGKRLSVTTRTMQEVGDRIGRYLATNAIVNAGFGLVVGTGLWLMGLQYAVLWGVLAAMLRFIPYVGTVISFALPMIYSLASYPGWSHALGVMLLFLVVETALNSFLEPIIYGKTTGVSALGLLVAAMFWTWLWGVWGLLLSTPITVALAVLGKYVPALRFFSTILGEEADLEPDVRFYQRLLALDEEGAAEMVAEMAKSRPRVEVFDTMFLPALARVERDMGLDEIDESTREFAWRVIDDLVEELEAVPMLETVSADSAATNGSDPIHVVGVPTEDRSDRIALRMLSQVVDPKRVRMEIVEDGRTPLALVESIADSDAQVVIVSHVPPGGLTSARYLVRKVRSRLADIPIVVGRWHEAGEAKGASERLTSAGATEVVFSIAEARDRLLASLPKVATSPPPMSPAMA